MDRRRRGLRNAWIDFQEYGASRLKAGDKLRVVRLPVFHRSDPPAERETVKTVSSVTHTEGATLVRLRGMRLPGHKRVLRPFRLSQGRIRGRSVAELTTGPPRPLRFEIHDVLPA